MTAATATSAEVGLPTPPPSIPEPGVAPAPRGTQPDAQAGSPPTGATSSPLALRRGASGPFVAQLQRALRRRGLQIAVDGSFGTRTRRAVVRMQRRLGLPRTGVADANLLRRLGVTVAADSGRTGSLKTFPVAGSHSYVDDWGAARAQGGHEGTDILADRNTPVLAADDGVITRMTRTETGLGGIYLWLRRPNGIQLYYAHMQAIAEGLDVGSRVSAGQVVGSVGNSGDARGGPTHLHFELRREWAPFDPYAELVAVDADHAPVRPGS